MTFPKVELMETIISTFLFARPKLMTFPKVELMETIENLLVLTAFLPLMTFPKVELMETLR